MNRRSFFRSGFKEITEAIIQKTPEPLRPKEFDPAFDISILTAKPLEAEQLANELLRDYFGESMLRLKQSELEGTFEGYVAAFENNQWKDIEQGIGMFAASARELARELAAAEPQTNPTLVRFVNKTPPFTRDVSIYRENALVRVLPLSEDVEFEIAGAVGTVRLAVAEGKCRILEAPEADASAVAHPAIITPGQRLICRAARITAIIGPPEVS